MAANVVPSVEYVRKGNGTRLYPGMDKPGTLAMTCTDDGMCTTQFMICLNANKKTKAYLHEVGFLALLRTVYP